MEFTITDLTKITTEHAVSQSSAAELQTAFMPFFEQINTLVEESKSIKVSNIGQAAEMGRAKDQFKAIQKLLIEVEKTRVEYKAESLQKGRAIDGMAHIIKHIGEPAKAYLESQWKYGERLREAQQAEQRDLRSCEFGKYIEFLPAGVDLGVIADEEHLKHLHMAKALWDAREAEQNRIENERIEREQREAAEREAMRVENERLKAEAAKVEAERAKEREAVEKIQREQAAKWEAERAENDRLRREAEAKERAEKERIEADKRRKEEAEKSALEAPDKVKIEAIIAEIKKVNVPDFAVKGSKQKVFSLIFDLEIELLKIVE